MINNGRTPRYCQLAGCKVQPGHTTRELDAFTASWKSVVDKSKGFDIILSESDVRLLAELCSKYLVPIVSNDPSVLKGMAGLAGLIDTMRDPDGTKVLGDRAREARAAMQALRSEAMRRERDREARIQAESNIIGPDGNPIAKVDLVSKDEHLKDVKPVRHEEMTTDLKSIIENNLAVMTTASGQKIENQNGPRTVIAKPGGTPVPKDPAAYRRPRTVPPGQPEMP